MARDLCIVANTMQYLPRRVIHDPLSNSACCVGSRFLLFNRFRGALTRPLPQPANTFDLLPLMYSRRIVLYSRICTILVVCVTWKTLSQEFYDACDL